MAATPPPASSPPPVDIPQRGDRTTFSARLDAFISWFNPGFSNLTAMVANAYTNALAAFSSAGLASGYADNALASAGLANGYKNNASDSAIAAAASAASAVNSPGTIANSTTSMTVSAITQTFTLTQTGKNFALGQTVVIANTASPAIQMTGPITAFNSATGLTTVAVSSIQGSGTFTTWTIALSGKKGDAGAVLNVIEIGNLIGMSQTANLVTLNGSDYLKTGVLASSASYTSAPLQNVFSETTRSITSSSYSGVASGNGITVAVSSASATGQISYDNGNTWAPVTLPSAGYNAITFGNNLFVAVGNGVCATSVDGINWFVRTIAAQNWTAILYDGVNYVAVSSSSSVGTYSANGTSWFASAMPSSQAWGALSCGNGLILATLNAGSSNVAASSADHGQTWTVRTLPKSFTFEPQNSSFGVGVFVVLTIDPAFSDTNCVFTTADCVTWNVRNYGVVANQTKTMTFAGGVFLATRSGSTTCYTSIDAGVTWVAKTMTVAHSPKATCVANGGRVIGVPSGSTTVDIFTMAYGRGYHIALFSDQQNQAIPLYMRMS